MGIPSDPIADREPERPPVQIGDMLAGKYVVERLLGVGGMGVVVAARHQELNELRAIKLMRRDSAVDADAVERFLREARAAVRLKSEHAVKIHDVGRLGTGEPYMVMEYLEGRDLKMLLRERGPLPVPETIALALQAIEAIAEAHAMGIVHRDLKPGNLFVTVGLDGEPVVKVLDFGISKLTDTGAGGAPMDMTKTSSMLGTPYYMSPEQMRSSRKVDVRTDVWALGVILYQLLTGRVPFKEPTITALCASVLQDEPIPPRQLRADLPPELEQVVLRCLQKKPAGRYANVADLAAALAPFGPQEARASVGRAARLLAATSRPGELGSLSGASPGVSGPWPSVGVSAPGLGAGDEHLAPTTPMSGPALADPGATAASWGRTGPLDRARLTPATTAAIAGVSVVGLVLVGVLVVLLRGEPDETSGAAVAVDTSATVADGPAGTAAGEVPVVLEEMGSAEAAGQGGAEAGQGGGGPDAGKTSTRPAPRGIWRRPQPKPQPKPTASPAEGDPFGEGRK